MYSAKGKQDLHRRVHKRNKQIQDRRPHRGFLCRSDSVHRQNREIDPALRIPDGKARRTFERTSFLRGPRFDQFRQYQSKNRDIRSGMHRSDRPDRLSGDDAPKTLSGPGLSSPQKDQAYEHRPPRTTPPREIKPGAESIQENHGNDMAPLVLRIISRNFWN